MLSHLSISNYALIDSIEVSFNKGFNVITGETGSGKSIIIGALGLVLGDRADSSVAKDKSKKSIIEATFDLSSFHLHNFFDALDLDFEEQTVVRREINTQGKSRAFVNDTPVNLNVLKDFASKVIDVHSQHKTIDLNKQSFQLNLVDALSNSSKELGLYKEAYLKYSEAKKSLEEFKIEAQKSKSDEDYLRFLLSEFDGINLSDEDLKTLEEEQNVLENAEEIKQSLSMSINRLDFPETGVLSNLQDIIGEISNITSYNSNYEGLHQRLNSTLIELRDVLSDIESLESDIEYNPQRLEEVSSILNKCYHLQKKHALSSVSDLLSFKEETEEKLRTIESSEDRIIAQENLVKELEKEAQEKAKQLSQKRQEAFKSIENDINNQFDEVAMASAQLNINCQEKDLSSDGVDDIQFLIKTNKGAIFQPIQNIASGGELSRIMLVLKTLLSEYNQLPTIIFDEIDTGISGEVADKVGGVMKKMSSNLQVFSITHLPQVASKGDNHFYVYKTEENNLTNTHLKLLSQSDRVVELAKMMSGEQPSKASLQSAKELLK